MTGRPTDDRLITTLADHDLEAALFDLAGALAPMTAPDLAAAVRSRVEGLGVPAPGLRRPLGSVPEGVLARLADFLPTNGRPLRRGLVLALGALLILAGLAAAIGFGLPGLRIDFLGPGSTVTPAAPATAAPPPSGGPGPSAVPTIQPTPTAALLDSIGLGERIDPSRLDAAAGRHVKLPTLTDLGSPLGLFVRGAAPATLVSAAYGPSTSVPAASFAPVEGGTPVAVIVMELPGKSDQGFLQKLLPEDTTIQPVTVGGHPGFWIAGRPHELLYVAPDGQVETESVRLVGNVLAWNDGELTYRIEGAPDLATAQRIAASMR